MKGQKQADDGARMKEELCEFRRVFEDADLSFREFRIHVMQNPPPPQLRPREWVPISDH
jgi:hypothetical protein